MTVLDTDVVTLLAYGTNERLRQRIEAVEDNEELAVTLITRMEILQGRFANILKAANREELSRAAARFRESEELLDSFVLLGVTEQALDHFQRLSQQKRLKMRRPDLLIACIVLAHDALLVTRNTKDYKGVNGLRVEDWTTA